MNLRELWNLVSSYGIVCFKLVFILNSDFSRPIFFNWLLFVLWCFLLENEAVKFSTRIGWTQRILWVDDFLPSDWHWDFRFLISSCLFFKRRGNPKGIDFRWFRMLYISFCCALLLSLARFSWLLLAFFSNVMFLHFDLTLSSLYQNWMNP